MGKTFTYWLLAQGTGLVKIGKSERVLDRVRTLRAMNAGSVELLLVHDEPEAKLHERFRFHRHHGEWFKISDRMVDYMTDIGEHGTARLLFKEMDRD